MSATMTASMPSTTVSAAAAAEKGKSQAESLRIAAKNKLAYAKGLLARALGWMRSTGSRIWSTVKEFAGKYGSLSTALGSAVMMTKKGWHTVAEAATKGLGYVARGALKAAEWGVKVGHKIVSGLSRIVGFFHKGAGAKVAQWNDQIAGACYRGLDRSAEYVKGTVRLAISMLTTDTTTAIVNGGAMAIGGSIAINTISGGALAASAAEMPAIGTFVASVVSGGPLAWLALGLTVAAGLAYTLFFNKGVDKHLSHHMVADVNVEEMFTEAYEAAVAEEAAVTEAIIVETAAIIDETAAINNQSAVIEDLTAEIRTQQQRPNGKKARAGSR